MPLEEMLKDLAERLSHNPTDKVTQKDLYEVLSRLQGQEFSILNRWVIVSYAQEPSGAREGSEIAKLVSLNPNWTYLIGNIAIQIEQGGRRNEKNLAHIKGIEKEIASDRELYGPVAIPSGAIRRISPYFITLNEEYGFIKKAREEATSPSSEQP